MRETQDNAYAQYRAELPTPQQVYTALRHLPTERALGMVERAAGKTGGWSRQLMELHVLLCTQGRSSTSSLYPPEGMQ